MLLQVKASLSHGEWLPWLKQQQESGAIGFSRMTATKYMRLAANINRGLHLPEAPSIRAALELLSDKEPDDEQLDLIPADIEAERQARIAAEQKAEEEQRRRAAFTRGLSSNTRPCACGAPECSVLLGFLRLRPHQASYFSPIGETGEPWSSPLGSPRRFRAPRAA